MTTANFRVAPDILRRLGEELNPSLDQGVLELVKNAYDADAHGCTVELLRTARVGGSIRVTDTGKGMDEEEILNGFLILGRSVKTGGALTHSGRIPVGSKGLGRLAALRSGKTCQLTTRPTGQDAEYQLKIRWADFDRASVVEQVPLEILRTRREKGAASGTEIVIEGLSQPIHRPEVKRLARALLLLADPFEDDPSSFQVELIAPEFRDLERRVRSKYFTEADYHLHAIVDSDGYATATVLDWLGKPLFEATHSDLRVGGDPYSTLPAVFDFWAFRLDSITFQTRNVTLSEVASWLREFGGIFLYLNGIRVSPYGDPGNDWLNLNLRRAQSPEERPSTNNSIGRLSVADPDAALLAKTDRAGLIDTEEFRGLQAFATDCLEWMARERMKIAEARRRRERTLTRTASTTKRSRVEEAIEGADPESGREIQSAFRDYDRARTREVVTLRREVQLYRTLSTVGIAASTFAHEASNGPLKLIERGVATLKRRVRALDDGTQETLKDPIRLIAKASHTLSVFGAATLALIDRDKRRVERIDLSDVISEVLELYGPFIEARDVKVDVHIPEGGGPYIHGSRAALESVVVNLLTNSLVALRDTSERDRTVGIRVTRNNGTAELVMWDNGPGFVDIRPSDIWLPGMTTRPSGSGLGLTIVRDSVADLGGTVGARDGEAGGVEFEIRLPALRG